MWLLLITGCNRQPPPAGNPVPPAPTIAVVKPEMRAVKRVVEQPGTVQAFEETALFANLVGYVGAIADDPDKKDRPPHDRQFDIGSRVKKDQVLATLAVPELEKELAQKLAAVKQAEAEVVQADKLAAAAAAGVTLAEAAVTESQAGVDRADAMTTRAEKEVARVAKQVSGGMDTSQALDDAQLRLDTAKATQREANAKVVSARAAVKKAEADREKAAADVGATKARLQVAREGVARVEALRGYTQIQAPFDGIITQRAVNTRDHVGPDKKAALFSVARIDPVRVVVSVPEAEAGLVTPGQEARLSLQAVQGPAVTGRVTRTSWSLEPGSRTLRTEIDLPNEKGEVRPGMYVYARLTAELPAAWSVPAAAVGKVGDETVMYLVENGKAVRVPVQLLKGDGQFTQVRRYKKSGAADWTDVTGTEQIATPASALSDGQTVP